MNIAARLSSTEQKKATHIGFYHKNAVIRAYQFRVCGAHQISHKNNKTDKNTIKLTRPISRLIECLKAEPSNGITALGLSGT